MRPRSAIFLFAVAVLAWLVPCFALWYGLAPWLDRPAAWLARIVVSFVREGLVSALEFDGRLVDFVTPLEVRQAGNPTGLLVVEVNPLLSTYGAPLFAALVLASRGGWRRFVLGLAILLPFQAWGIAFEFLAQILRTDRAMVEQAGLGGWRAPFIALAYQAGSLIFPTLVPLATWAALERRFIESLVAPRPPAG